MDEDTETDLPAYMTPLYFAVVARDFKKARSLIEAGHSLADEPADDCYSLLHRAVEGGECETVRFLLSAGSSGALNSFDYVQRTPLIVAVQKGHLEIAELLIEAGADVNAHNEACIGNTALREAAHVGDVQMVRLLLSAGADPRIRGWMQMDALAKASLQVDRAPKSEARRLILAMLKAHS